MMASEVMTSVINQRSFPWPDNPTDTCFQLTTIHISGRGGTPLRHLITGLRNIEMYEEAHLLKVNQTEVRSWSHQQVVAFVNEQFQRLSDDDITLVIKARDKEGRKHKLEVTITVIYEDGLSLGDRARAAYDIIVRTVDKIITTPDVTDVEFAGSDYVRVRHGAQTGFFLKEGTDHTMCMAIPPSENDDYVFKCYKFFGHNLESQGRGGGGGGDGEFPILYVLQQPRSGRFVTASTSGRLLTDKDAGFRTSIESITKPDCHFFVVHRSCNTSDTFCLCPLVMPNYYLRYDAMSGLKLEKCVLAPYKNFTQIRFFSFEFVPAQYTGDSEQPH